MVLFKFYVSIPLRGKDFRPLHVVVKRPIFAIAAAKSMKIKFPWSLQIQLGCFTRAFTANPVFLFQIPPIAALPQFAGWGPSLPTNHRLEMAVSLKD